jgi:hypothetical protein
MRWKTSRTCVRICEAKFGTLFRYDGKLIETRLRRSSPSGLSSWREPANTIPTFCVSGYCSNSLSQRLKPAEYHLIDLATGLSLANTHARKPCRPGKSSAEMFASSSTIRGRPTTSDNAGSPAAPGWPGAADVRRASTLPKVIKRADILG